MLILANMGIFVGEYTWHQNTVFWKFVDVTFKVRGGDVITQNLGAKLCFPILTGLNHL